MQLPQKSAGRGRCSSTMIAKATSTEPGAGHSSKRQRWASWKYSPRAIAGSGSTPMYLPAAAAISRWSGHVAVEAAAAADVHDRRAAGPSTLRTSSRTMSRKIRSRHSPAR